MAAFAQIEADNAAALARAAARHSFRDLAAAAGSPIARRAKEENRGEDRSAAVIPEAQETWDAEFDFADTGSQDPFAATLTSAAASADAFDG